MEKIIQIQNLKCRGCESTIRKHISMLNGVKVISLSIPNSEIKLTVDNETTYKSVLLKLSQMGYPIVGDKNTLTKKAKSYVSCAIGKFND